VRDTKSAVEETHATELLQLQLLQKAVAARPVQAPTTPPRQESPAPAMSEEAPPRSGMLSRAPIATMLPRCSIGLLLLLLLVLVLFQRRVASFWWTTPATSCPF
jgi:hypothetical protein